MAIVLQSYMIKVYAMLIKSGKRTIETIPQSYVEEVVKYLESEAQINQQ